MLKLFFHYSRENRYSVNALAGAIEHLKNVSAVFPGTAAEMEQCLRDAGQGPCAAAFSFFTSQKEQTSALVKRLRAAAPGAVFIAGGPHASAAPRETLAMGFDYVIAGEGEAAFPQLLTSLASGVPPRPGVIKGPAVRLGEYPPFSQRYGLLGPIEITRGCPFACSYCQTSFLFGTKPRHRPLPSILRHMHTLLSQGVREIRFITPDAFAYGSPDGKELCLPALTDFMRGAHDLAEKRGGMIFVGSFPSEVRPEHVTPATLELVKKYASNRRLLIGAQTASPRALKSIRRGHGPEEILAAARLCREYKITPYLDFIFGLPGETRKDEDASMEMITTLSALGAMIHSHAFMPLPGTPLAGAPDAAISPRMRKFIENMESRGKAFGPWRVQSLPAARG
jgi:B12-binding domain/radical SAM domain protein